jgi:hypothetical protein
LAQRQLHIILCRAVDQRLAHPLAPLNLPLNPLPLINIGPRQTIALSGSIIKPIDIIVTPCVFNGMFDRFAVRRVSLLNFHHARLVNIYIGIQQPNAPPSRAKATAG